ncbi:MAG TPA: TetR family transcriptional regulator [Clostridiales bacterium]|nr:TetR-like C-terminal domain-containing protein [Clostridia bacterium]MDD4680436.1 TetR-like C-terminal domain-containing protein [Clostridia bacterium]HCS75351.1 TetR family transcriptional regulator [Clostridiales bacterium]
MKKTDRRVKYTKALLKEALVDLLKDHHISKISVTALCDEADVNRSTFYAHYTDQFDLLRQIEDEVINNLKIYLEQYMDDRMPITEQNLKGILEYAKTNADLFVVLLGENVDHAFHNDLMELVELIPFQYNAVDSKKEYLLTFAITGCISVLYRWLVEGREETPEEMANLVLKVIYNGLLSF